MKTTSSILAWAATALAIATPSPAAEPTTFSAVLPAGPAQTQAAPATSSAPASPGQETAAPAPERPRDRLGWLEQRRLGVTPRNVARLARQLQDEGLIDDQTPRAAIALMIADRLQAENPGAWQPRLEEAKQLKAAGDTDWDAFLKALTQILEMLLELLERFGWLSVEATTAGGDLAAWEPGGLPVELFVAA